MAQLTTSQHPSSQISLPSLPWRHQPPNRDVSTLSTVTSPIPQPWRHCPLYRDVTNPSTMTSLSSLPWRQYPLLPWRHYPLLPWRHYPLYHDVTTLPCCMFRRPCRHPTCPAQWGGIKSYHVLDVVASDPLWRHSSGVSDVIVEGLVTS